MAGLWNRLRGRRSPPPDASSVTDVFADAAIAREDLEPAARPPTPRPPRSGPAENTSSRNEHEAVPAVSTHV